MPSSSSKLAVWASCLEFSVGSLSGSDSRSHPAPSSFGMSGRLACAVGRMANHGALVECQEAFSHIARWRVGGALVRKFCLNFLYSFSIPFLCALQSMLAVLLLLNTVTGSSSDQDGTEDGPDGFRYKPDGLTKLSFSITTSDGQHLHLISYFARSDPSTQTLKQPSLDPSLLDIRPTQGVYPESSINDFQTAAGAVQGPTAAFAYNVAQHHPSLYGTPHSLPQGYDQTSNGYTITAGHPDVTPFHPRSPDRSFAVQPISHPLAHHHPQTLQNGFRNGPSSDHFAQSNGQVSSPIGWQSNGYEVRASPREVSPSIITDFGDTRCSRYPSSSTAPSPGSDERSQDISPRTPSHPAVALPGTNVMDVDSRAVLDSRQDDYPHISPSTNLSIEAIIHRDDSGAAAASSSDLRNCRRVNRADSKSPSISGRVSLGAQEIFKEKYGFAEDKRVLRQLDTNAFSNK